MHFRLLPFLELSSAYNAWNHTFGARWNDQSPIQYEMPNGTVIVMAIPSFLCPSDQNPGASTGLNNFGGTDRRGVELSGERRPEPANQRCSAQPA